MSFYGLFKVVSSCFRKCLTLLSVLIGLLLVVFSTSKVDQYARYLYYWLK